jgi:hypothetical protein
MRFIRLFGALIIFYSLSYLLYGLVQLVSFLFVSDRTELLKYVEINLSIGSVTFIVGIGLLLAKEWARIAMLITTIVLLVIHGMVLIYFYAAGKNPTLQIMNFLLMVLLVLISWTTLTKASVKKHFT